MDALVVYESMWGNTRAVAEAVAQTLSTGLDVDVVEVGAAAPFTELDVGLLVVGAPTHAFGLSRPTTRQDAARRAGGPVISSTIGLREWIEASSSARLPVATFDTHVRHPNVPGHAGRAAATLLRRRGCTLVDRPQSFDVEGYEGPLLPGELDRARRWAGGLVGRLSAAVPRR